MNGITGLVVRARYVAPRGTNGNATLTQRPADAVNEPPTSIDGARTPVSASWQQKFAAIDRLPRGRDGRIGRRNWNIPRDIKGLLFGPFYYMWLGMYRKGICLLCLPIIFFSTLSVDPSKPILSPLDTLLGVGFTFTYCFRYVALDYYYAIRHGERMWKSRFIGLKRALVLTVAVVLVNFAGRDIERQKMAYLARLNGVWLRKDYSIVINTEKKPYIVAIGQSSFSCQMFREPEPTGEGKLTCSEGDKTHALAVRLGSARDGARLLGLTIDGGEEQVLVFAGPHAPKRGGSSL